MVSYMRAAAVIAFGLLGAVSASASPTFREDGPHGEVYGVSEGYPEWKPQPGRMPFRFFVGTFSHYDQYLPARTIPKGDAASTLRRAEQDLAATYTYDRARRTLADYVDRNPVMGLLIARGDTILYERYQYGRTEQDRFVSQSMAKTVTAMLIGIALAEGKIASIEDPVSKYVPDLAGSEYGGTRLRSLLTMSSGVQFREDYGGADDISRLGADLFGPRSPGTAAAVRQFNTRLSAPDTVFSLREHRDRDPRLGAAGKHRDPRIRVPVRSPLAAARRRGGRHMVGRQERAGGDLLLPHCDLARLRPARADARERRRLERQADRPARLGHRGNDREP